MEYRERIEALMGDATSRYEQGKLSTNDLLVTLEAFENLLTLAKIEDRINYDTL